jgi:hypothetical protein
MRTRRAIPLVLVFLASTLALAQSDPRALQITALPTQGAIVGQNYTLPLAATGGQSPYTWQLVKGELPPGLRLQSHKGAIVGVPTTAGEYHFTVSVGDSNIPQLQAQRDFTISVIAGLTVEWKEPPAVHGNTISGSAVITNQTPANFDLTVVVVAVNKIGKATTLGYQHFILPAQATSPVIPFSSAPGLGTYFVRVDAVGHHPGHQRVYRSNKQTSAALHVGQL